jgi:Uma2 family endonuclease
VGERGTITGTDDREVAVDDADRADVETDEAGSDHSAVDEALDASGLDLPETAPAAGPEPESPAPEDPLLDHDGPWSEEDYRTLTAKGIAHGDGRAELIDGALVVGPGSTAEGDRMITRTRAALAAAMPDGLCVVGPVALRMGTDCVLVPDLVVMRASGDPDGAQEAVVDAEEVLMVVEIVGPEHGAMDRSFKPQIYARARLPYLLLVDHDVPSVAASMVISGRYHEYARASGADALQLEEPFRLKVRLAEQ